MIKNSLGKNSKDAILIRKGSSSLTTGWTWTRYDQMFLTQGKWELSLYVDGGSADAGSFNFAIENADNYDNGFLSVVAAPGIGGCKFNGSIPKSIINVGPSGLTVYVGAITNFSSGSMVWKLIAEKID